MANSRLDNISDEETPLINYSLSNAGALTTEKFSSDEDELLDEKQYQGTASEEELITSLTKAETLIDNLNQKNFQERVQYIESLNLSKKDFYDYAQDLMNKIDDFCKTPKSLSADQRLISKFAGSMGKEVYLMQDEFNDNNDTKFCPVLIGLSCTVNALEQPHNEDNITILGDLYNDIKDKPELGAASLGRKIAGGLLICLGILATAAFVTLALASVCTLTPAALAGMGFAGSLIAAGTSMLGGAAGITATLGITAGALSTTTGIGCAIAGSEQSFASSTHGLFNCAKSIRDKLNPKGFCWKTSIYSDALKETDFDTKVMAIC